MSITREQYDAAVAAKKAAEETINQFHREEDARFKQRLESGVPFTDDELLYSAYTLCPCGHGLAYPKGCGGWHYRDCSAILKGTADKNVTHTGKLPFAFYDVKSENERRGTTRGVFKPQPPKPDAQP